MKHLIKFESYKPNDDQVKEIMEILKKEYPIKETDLELSKPVRYIMLDDKQIFLGSPMGSKVDAVRKISNDINSKTNGKYLISSINKAIKDHIK